MKVRTVLGALLVKSPMALAAMACAEDSCFVAGTLVATPLGPRPIDSLRLGDVVWSFCLVERRLVARAVIAIHRAFVREVRHVDIGPHEIRGVTPSHPIYAPSAAGYRPARELVRGAAVALLEESGDVTVARVESVEATETPAPTIEVWNIGVEGPHHNYFADGVLVHNKSTAEAACEAKDVRVELVTVAPYSGRYDVRVTFAELPPERNRAEAAKNFFVGEGSNDVWCDAPTQTNDTTWTCALKPLGPGMHELYVAGYAFAKTVCQIRQELTVTVPARTTADAGVGDASSD